MPARTACAACAHPSLDVFLDLGESPLANKFPTQADLGHEKFYPLQLGRCASCGLVQMMELIPDTEIYGADYGFYSGGSQAQRDYHKQGALMLAGRYLSPHNDQYVVEVACNDGSMLQHFSEWGYRTLGIDPAQPAQDAKDAGLNVLVEPFTYDLARAIRDDHGPADLVIAYNSLAHVNNLPDVLMGIRALLNDNGIAVVEVQYLPDLLAGNMIDQVYHEHRYYHSLSSFKRAAELHGLNVLDAELIELQGGGMRITLTPGAVRTREKVERILENEQWINLPGTYAAMQGRIERVKEHLLSIMETEWKAGRSIAGFAAAAKATTILNFCMIGPQHIPFVIDSTPFKQGRFVPGTEIPIVEDAKSDTLLCLAPNYISTLVRNYGDRRIIMPLPAPYVI